MQDHGGDRSISIVKEFPLSLATMTALKLSEMLKPHCTNIVICGGVRRRKENVHDIDIVIQPYDFFMVSTVIGSLGGKSTKEKFLLTLIDIPIEIWIAYDEFQFEVLKLVRTGSAGFNQHLAMMAHNFNMVLRFSKGMYGLYAAVYNKVEAEHKKKWIINPQRRLWWRELDMIGAVFGKDNQYINPENRNVEFQIYSRAEEDTAWQ